MSMLINTRTPEGVSVVEYHADGDFVERAKFKGTLICSRAGNYLASVTEDQVTIYTAGDYSEVCTIPERGVFLSEFSNTGEFFVTLRKPFQIVTTTTTTPTTNASTPVSTPSHDSAASNDAAAASSSSSVASAGQNLKIWEAATGRLVFQSSQRQASRDAWPSVNWSSDDTVAVTLVSNNAHVYRAAGAGDDAFKRYDKLAIPNVQQVAVSPSPAGSTRRPYLASFSPEVKSNPGNAAILELPGAGAGASGSTSKDPIRRVFKSFFQAQHGSLLWNSKGSACLALATCDFDAKNQSYFGDQKLYYLAADVAAAKEPSCQVPLPKEGPVNDVAWAPSGDFFVVIAGYMPAKVTLYNEACVAKFDLGSGPYNMVRWNPYGRVFCLAGFGNLPGDVAFFEKKRDGKCYALGKVRSPAVTAEWSPDGRHLLLATTAPRMRVDNQYRVLHYHGAASASSPMFPEALLEASWVPPPPAQREALQDRPLSPGRATSLGADKAATGEAEGKGASAAVAGGNGRAEESVKKGYVPPHLRAAGATTPVAGNFSLSRDLSENKPGVIKAKSTSERPASAVPGNAGPMSAAALKNAKRAAAKAKAKAEAGTPAAIK
mmetsp:Transcript_31531/g.57290  ORF Transcript_31531/g.57290 Transcript_31531/m.57290 type:complete len:604 (-) Transcript_31531:203-2014(-)|eukprot:CAMPEP_0175077972 /NCGR_PEP_ID=MMETSP0052_2-20121109/23783_1 /TAXON_ID=51329 ORGANISM="Polytomella parva, Strain SAG 63-3" /NCGR_SAMPLE_ID=MMETSP0052_2 /ASSEMBLY_ACC=CAM_ASM_000194 /LENGTH=603 /DNA_ID=CAMNT_0016347689 /DNA_START=27 /DNA_END=1838 /DNA_ORIENTATION=+